MTERFIDTYKDKPRRETLVALVQAFDNEEQLEAIVKDSALVACSLVLIARDDGRLQEKLARYLDVDELLNDIVHVRESEELRKKRNEMRV